jgi:hypothetical protein
VSRRLLSVAAVAALAGGAAFALADDPAPTAPTDWRTRPEVPGVARTLVPFGTQTTADGPRTWALGQAEGTTVVLHRAPSGGWSADRLLERGAPVGGPAPQHAGEMAPDGRAAVLLADPADPAADATLLTRDPDGAFTPAPAPGGALAAGEQLVGDATQPGARAFLAVLGGDDADTGTYVAPTAADGTGTAVLHLTRDGWTREPIDAPGVDGPLRPVGLAATSGSRTWLLARSGDGLVLLQRRSVAEEGTPPTTPGTTPTPPSTTETTPTPAPGTDTTPAPPPTTGTTPTTTGTTPTTTGTTPTTTGTTPTTTPTTTGTTPTTTTPTPDPGGPQHWVPADLAPDALLGGAALPDGVRGVTVVAGPGDPLTVSADGLWIDLRLTTADGEADATVHLRTTDAGEAWRRAAVAVDGRWCDVRGDVCDHPLGLTFPRGVRGYRSLGLPGDADAPFGGRVVSSPVDRGVPTGAARHDAQRQGGYAQLAGDGFVLRDGIGEDDRSTTQAIAFAPDGSGFTGGTVAFGAATAGAETVPADSPVPSFGDPVVAAAPSPQGDGRVLALSRSGQAAVLVPGHGWRSAASAVTYSRADGRSTPIRAVAWPRPNTVIGVGGGGTLTTANEDPVDVDQGWLGDDVDLAPTDDFDLPARATLLDVDCTATGELACVAAGRAGLVVVGDGRRWEIERLPAAAAQADVTSVAYDGTVPVIATSVGLYRREGDAWTPDGALQDAMRQAGQGPGVRLVATVTGGGIVADGRWTRDAQAAPWRATGPPLTLHPTVLAAIRDEDGRVRSLVTGTPAETPLPAPPTPADPTLPTDDDDDGEGGGFDDDDANVPVDPSPVGAVTLRETADGWIDLDRAAYEPSGGRDLPATTPDTRVLVVDPAGSGWMLGGLSGAQATLRDRPAVSTTTTAGWLQRGRRATPPESVVGPPVAAPTAGPELPVPPGSVRLAVGGHPACLDRCTGGNRQGTTPDIHLADAVARVEAMRQAGAGPAALIVGGGRASVGGEPLDEAGARRYRSLLQGTGVPTYALPGPGDLPGGGEAAFAAAFATAAAPQGSGAPGDGVSVDPGLQPEPAPEGAARNRFTFDVRGAPGTVRVIAIDNAAGRLAGGPTGDQARWITAVLAQARQAGIPVVAVGSVPLTADAQATPAADAAEELALLVGHASAYVATAGVDDPASMHFGGALARGTATVPGGAAPMAVFQSATLGYGRTDAALAAFDGPSTVDGGDGGSEIEEAIRQTEVAIMLLDVDVSRRDPATGVAPVTPTVEPLATDMRVTGGSTVPLGAASQIGVEAQDPAPQRYYWKAADGVAQEAAAPRTQYLPTDSCRLYLPRCATMVRNDVRFGSSAPAVARFVAVDPGDSDRAPRIRLDEQRRVVEDPLSGILCPTAAGSTTVSVLAAGQQAQLGVTVVPIPPEAGVRPVLAGSDGAPIPQGTCTFSFSDVAGERPAPAASAGSAGPDGAVEPPPVPAGSGVEAPVPVPGVGKPVPVPVPAPPTPQAVPHAPAPSAPTPPPAAMPVAPAVPQPPPDGTTPPAAPAAKPAGPAQPPPPAPHQVPASQPGSALQTQVQAQPQVQAAARAAEQRRRREAYESDDAASAYAQPPSRLPWELAGGIAVVLLAAGGGAAAGRLRRRPATAAAGRRR